MNAGERVEAWLRITDHSGRVRVLRAYRGVTVNIEASSVARNEPWRDALGRLAAPMAYTMTMSFGSFTISERDSDPPPWASEPNPIQSAHLDSEPTYDQTAYPDCCTQWCCSDGQTT